MQIGASPPNHGKQYPAHLTGADTTLRNVLAQIAEFQKQRGSEDPTESCKKTWSLLRVLFVADPADADKIDWGRCNLPNERNFMTCWTD